MRNWDMNTIISWGLVVMGVIAVAGWILLSYKTGTSSGTEIPIAIVSGLGGVLTGQKLQERKQQSQTLGNVSEVAGQVQAIANAVDDLGKNRKSGESRGER